MRNFKILIIKEVVLIVFIWKVNIVIEVIIIILIIIKIVKYKILFIITPIMLIY